MSIRVLTMKTNKSILKKDIIILLLICVLYQILYRNQMISIHPFQNGNHETTFLEKYIEILPKYSHVTILFSEMTAAIVEDNDYSFNQTGLSKRR